MNRYILFFLALSLFTLSACDSAAPTGVDPVSEKPDPEPPPSNGSETTVAIDGQQNGIVVDLSWKTRSAPNDPTFDLYRGFTADFDTTGRLFVTLTDSTYQDGEVEEDRSYHYKVAVRGTKALSGPASIRITDKFPPEPASNLNAAGGFYRAELSWDPSPSDDVEGYYVYRSTSPFQFTNEAARLTTDAIQSNQYTDDEALDGKRYYYRVTVVDDAGNQSETTEAATATPTFSGDPIQGKRLWNEECSACHLNGDAWDLQKFAMPDTMIHRRALGHVQHEDALDILAFVHSGDVQPFQDARYGRKETPPFQPGNRILSSDREFAMNLFGEDQWPADLTVEELRNIDLTNVPVPFKMPEWNLEGDGSDWLPSKKLPPRIADQSVFKTALENYYDNPTDENMLRVYKTIHQVDRDAQDRYVQRSASTEERVEVYELNRWISSFIAQHILRKKGDPIQNFRDFMNGSYSGDLMGEYDRWAVKGKYRSVTTEFWAVGGFLREQALFNPMPVQYGSGKEAAVSSVEWWYLAWMLRGELEPSFDDYYFTQMFDKAGYKRVAAFYVAYSIVNTPMGVQKVYNLTRLLNNGVPERWMPNFSRFVVNAYVYRIENGDFVEVDTRDQRNHITDGINTILKKNSYLSERDREYLREKRDFIVNWLKEQETEIKNGKSNRI